MIQMALAEHCEHSLHSELSRIVDLHYRKGCVTLLFTVTADLVSIS